MRIDSNVTTTLYKSFTYLLTYLLTRNVQLSNLVISSCFYASYFDKRRPI